MKMYLVSILCALVVFNFSILSQDQTQDPVVKEADVDTDTEPVADTEPDADADTKEDMEKLERKKRLLKKKLQLPKNQKPRNR